MVEELGTSAMEEFDLLVKWLGPQSAKQAKSIRAANADDPKKGLSRVWERLDERFGSPEIIQSALKQKLSEFPKLGPKDNKRLYELADIVSEIESVKENPHFSCLFAYYDSSTGVAPIVEKLPFNLQEKWITRASRYKSDHRVTYPPFHMFASFVREMSKVRNDPSFFADTVTSAKRPTVAVSTRSTLVSQHKEPVVVCPLHKTNHHVNDCRGFKSKSLEERRKILKENGLCFRCCEGNTHKSRECKAKIRCSVCRSERHSSAMHEDRAIQYHSGETKKDGSNDITSKCTQVCGQRFGGKSCAKIVLVKVYQHGNPDNHIVTYAILDDQSNRSLAKSEIFDKMGLPSKEIEYSLSSCGGVKVLSGKITDTCVIESLDSRYQYTIPSLLECDQIPNIREEIPTPEVALYHRHLNDI